LGPFFCLQKPPPARSKRFFGDSELYGETIQARQWIERLLHQLCSGGEQNVVQEMEKLLAVGDNPARTQSLSREIEYFKTHADHLHYQKAQAQGCPCGSGAMESTCAQLQDRFKRTGQFWSHAGKAKQVID
jgi:3-methyladenine DNA glycosylase Tag